MGENPAAKMLDALSEWVAEQSLSLLTRHPAGEETFRQAGAKSRLEALKSFHSSGSFEESFRAGKRAFKSEVRAQLAPNAPRLSEWDFGPSEIGGASLS